MGKNEEEEEMHDNQIDPIESNNSKMTKMKSTQTNLKTAFE